MMQTVGFGISRAQLEYWNKLAHILDAECPELAQHLDTLSPASENLVSELLAVTAIPNERQQLVLNMLCNNVQVSLSFPKQEYAHQYIKTLQCLPPASFELQGTMTHHLCAKHRLGAFDTLKHKPVLLGSYLMGEEIPEGLPTRLQLAVQYFYLCYGGGGGGSMESPLVRVFDSAPATMMMTTAENGYMPSYSEEVAGPNYVQHATIKLQPRYIGSIDDMRVYRDEFQHQPSYYHAHMKNHLYCYFCFPTLLGIVAHATQTGYLASINNIPKNMRVVLNMNPRLRDPVEFEKHVHHMCCLLHVDCVDEDESLTEVGKRARNAYNSIISELWTSSSQQLDIFDARLQARFVHLFDDNDHDDKQ